MAIFHAEFFSKCLMRLVDVDICLPIEDLAARQLYCRAFPPVRHCRGNAQWGKQLL